MILEEFSKEFKKHAKSIDIEINEEKIKQLYEYMNLIIAWNEKINLTAITEPKEMIIKHFIDSLTIAKQIKKGAKIIDIGTGAGFPGIPLKIYQNDCNITLLDSLNKRTLFLKEVVEKLGLNGVEIIHGRAEDYAQERMYREKYDISVSRAVAPLNILLEYLVPYTKVNGKIIAMKGSNAKDEIDFSENAIKKLEINIEKIEEIKLPEESGNRYIITFEKCKSTSKIYPRKAGIPKKNPL